MLKPILVTIFLVFSQIALFGQSSTSDTTKTKAIAASAVTEKEEVVEGLWAVSSYLGQKLADELSNRMNLGESNDTVVRKPKKVTLVIGSFKFERMD